MGERLDAGAICTRLVTFAERAMPVNEAAQLMRSHHVGCLVVTDDTPAGRVPVGILTDRDIVTAVVAKDVDPRTLRVEDVMSADLVVVPEDASVIDLLRTMRSKGLRRLPVVDAQGLLAGLVTLDDLLGIIAEELRATVAAIEAEQARETRMRR
ncbi:CBS domain-containing protein [Calidifontimicrobium sp. SYSU G02091]|uniref:CBS domain-containing protein n=1 Tax=Calidifontimicrobium sp. SYSU G02091 TaxID=2926421 RepID=UPI001F537C37|nr:CBS domain-containing protein [Calidifontimicrobium sp. SYSU G02091]MCI1192087.1 CBS domain-containing protein [Calidifontimicrobium sp. SYSU G02091]